MNDTQILDWLIERINTYLHEERPASNVTLHAWRAFINDVRGERRRKHTPELTPIGRGTVTNGAGGGNGKAPSPYQHFTLTAEPQLQLQQCDPTQSDHSYNSIENKSPTCGICGKPSFTIPRLGLFHVCTGQEKQEFWRCLHYPSAIENWWVKRDCEHGCQNNPLRWFDNGTHRDIHTS